MGLLSAFSRPSGLLGGLPGFGYGGQSYSMDRQPDAFAPVSIPMGGQQQAPQEAPKRGGFFDKLGRIGDILATAGNATAVYGPVQEEQEAKDAFNQWLANPDDQVAFHRAIMANPDRALAIQKALHPNPVNNDTVADYEFIRQRLGDDAANQFLQNKANPPVWRQGDDGKFYRVDTGGQAPEVLGNALPPGWQIDGGPTPQASGGFPGVLTPGNIDLHSRPIVRNRDGSISTVRSVSFGLPEGEVLVPTVSDDGRIMSNDEALATYRRTGKHLGIFRSPQEANAYAQSLHQQQAEEYLPQGGFPDPTRAPGRMTSGRRTPEGNKLVGGVPKSNHLTGDAADYVGASPAQLRSYFGPNARLLNEGDHVHVTLPGFGKVPYFGRRGTTGLKGR